MNIVKKCIVCDETLQGNRNKFCSNKCSMRFKYENNKDRLNSNTYNRQIEQSVSRKIALIKLRGDCGCEICGYKKNISALELHHIDSNQKSFPLDARNLGNRSWSNILEEFKKCVFLCANCHREYHNPELIYDEITIYAYVEKRKKKYNCVDCGVIIDNKATRCKNCHGLKNRKIERPSTETLNNDVVELGYSGTGRKYGVSDNTIRKWLK